MNSYSVSDDTLTITIVRLYCVHMCGVFVLVHTIDIFLKHYNKSRSVVDSQGFLWNATWRQGEGTGMVDRIDPNTGDVVFTVHLPDETSEASCCCFGGKNLDILFITTAREHLDPESEPHAGGLYAVKLPPGMIGCQEKRFRID